MTWKCLQCGVENTDGERRICEGCGDVSFGTLVLTAKSTGDQRRIRIDTLVGRRLLSGFAGEDSQFSSEPQFELKKDPKAGGWSVVHCDKAINPTCLNGDAVPAGGTLLTNGDVLSVGPSRLKLTVSVERA